MELLERLQSRQKQDADLFLHRMLLARQPVTLTGYKSLIDLPHTMMLLQQQAQNAVAEDRPLFALASGIGEYMNDADEQAVIAAISEGNLVVFPDGSDMTFKLTPVNRTLSRSIEAPTTENVLRGSISAFIEDIDTNLGILKKQFISDKLRIQSYWVGTDQRRRAIILYTEGKASSKFNHDLIQKIESNLDKDIPNLQALAHVLGFSKWVLAPGFNTTELPQNAAWALGQGKTVLFLDRFPFAIIMPSVIMDMFAAENDHNFLPIFMFIIRFLRIIGVLSNMLMPGLYVALVSVNPDVLRIELALSIAGSREGVPYPAVFETLLLLVILELTLESSVRLPKTIGPTITMVGGIILGQAVVQAQLVSNVLIIILAATTIASFAVVGFNNAVIIRLPKYLILILSAMYGVLGLFVGMMLVCASLASASVFGIPYLYKWKAREHSDG
ncbi:spore germination protein [Paenibacillus hamazuiensis]|uniref:spore germination protein n=1 Tax=Paenibacillus hamazuiensis TaxID=2936508 RepID=UPI00200C4DD5|nr:spore germination protein [Paenibacillus hamazuiensis]